MTNGSGKLILVIGNRNYSSWSLRPWLWMRQRGIVFEEIRVPLFEEDTDERLAEYFSGDKVPVLLHGDRIIWDSLAILEYLNDTYPHYRGWPEQAEARALARSITAEMHSSFMALREALPMNCRRPVTAVELSEEVQQDVDQLTGAAVLIRSSLLNDIGRMEDRFFMYSEDVDLFLRILKTGHRLVYTPEAVITHVGGQSSCQICTMKKYLYHRSELILFQIHRHPVAYTCFLLSFLPLFFLRLMTQLLFGFLALIDFILQALIPFPGA